MTQYGILQIFLRPRAAAITWLFKIIPVCASWPEFQWNNSTLCSDEQRCRHLSGSKWCYEFKYLVLLHCLWLSCCMYTHRKELVWLWGNEFKPRLNNYFVYFSIFDFLREGHQTEFRCYVFSVDRMEQRMVTWILDREVAGSRPLCILCFFIYRFTGAGVEGAEAGDTKSEEGNTLD